LRAISSGSGTMEVRCSRAVCPFQARPPTWRASMK
jgi:hypothetical protein